MPMANPLFRFRADPASGFNSLWPKFIRLVVLVVFCLALGSFCAQAALGGDTNATVQLILSADTAKPGDTITAGLHFKMKPDWHIYWRNAGDAGYPTTNVWTLPPGVTAGEIQWPVPQKSVASDLTDYIYNREVVLLIPLKLAPDLAPGPLTLKGDVTWLDCDINSACVPGESNVEATLNIGAETKASASAALIETWHNRLPSSGASLDAKLSWVKTTNDDTRSFTFDWAATNAPARADFYPYNANYAIQLKTDTLTASAGHATLTLQIKKTDGDWPPQMAGLLVATADTGKSAYEISLPLQSSPAGTTATAISTEGLAASIPAADTGALNFLSKLFAAFLGGLILNIMPCVLPVIALKILGFVKQAGQSPARTRQLGLIYAAGILVSFLALAALIIVVKSLGHAASWGMQFEDPRFVLVMTVLITLVALNLFGVFEINLGGHTMQAAGDLAAREGAPGAFFNGVLAVALATPCTAPFLASALGYAFTQPASVIIIFFLTIGLGLAAPYVVLCWQPAWLKFLPKPGLWMQRFKMLMGFPMLATAVWLFTLAAPNFGTNSYLWLGLFLVVVALTAWIWGQFVQQARHGKTAGVIIAVALLAFAYGFILERQLHWRNPVVASASDGKLSDAPAGINWQSWSPDAVLAARNSGHPVLVDFTAPWCVTCQLFVKPVLESSAVRSKLTEINAVPLLEDSYTKDATVVAELNRYERAGVPLVLVYSPNPSTPPQVLPNVLTQGIVLDALNQAAKQ
jgi:thiol:disulfide interchange protein